MAQYTVDLHIHTVLSPCAGVEMIPPLIVEAAVEAGLDLIAVTDHNSAENAGAVIEAADGAPLKVLPGLECESLEGVHLVCLFDETDQALAMQETIYAALPDLPNRPETFGPQFVVDATGEFIRHNDRLLLVPAELTIEQIFDRAVDLGGIVFPSHVDRPHCGIYGVLGFMPEVPRFDAVEISCRLTPEQAVCRYPDLEGRALFRCSDAHVLEDIGRTNTILDLPHRTVAEIRKAVDLRGQGKRPAI